jgi:uncharacterized protein (DUF362 family)
MEQLDVRPHGRTLVKPNIVMSGSVFQHVHTKSEFVEGVLLALKDRTVDNHTRIAVGERCGSAIPTRFAYKSAGYNSMLKRTRIKRYCFDEETQVKVPLSHPERLHEAIYVPRPIAEADFFVNCPKFKLHELTTVSLSLKNYIGIQDDRHRLIDHNHGLNRKIADLQHVIQPKVIALDAIVACRSSLFEPNPIRLNMIIVGNNQVALDAIGCYILGIDPATVEHIALSHKYGFGPLSLDKIQLGGDVSLDEAKERARELASVERMSSAEKYFATGAGSCVGYKGGRIRAHTAPPPAQHRRCVSDCGTWFGCAIEYLGLINKKYWDKIPRLCIVSGVHTDTIHIEDDEYLLLVGSCTSCRAVIRGKEVFIPSIDVNGLNGVPDSPRPKDVSARMFNAQGAYYNVIHDGYTRLKGCPVALMEGMVVLNNLVGLYMIPIQFGLVFSLFRRLISVGTKRIVGKPYQIRGACRRGDAMPQGIQPVSDT